MGKRDGNPHFQFVMLPLVSILGDGQEWTMRDVTDLLAEIANR